VVTTSPSSTARPGEKCWPASYEDAEEEHGQTGFEAGAAVLESDREQERKCQVGAEVQHIVVDVQAADRDQDCRATGATGNR